MDVLFVTGLLAWAAHKGVFKGAFVRVAVVVATMFVFAEYIVYAWVAYGIWRETRRS